MRAIASWARSANASSTAKASHRSPPPPAMCTPRPRSPSRPIVAASPPPGKVEETAATALAGGPSGAGRRPAGPRGRARGRGPRRGSGRRPGLARCHPDGSRAAAPPCPSTARRGRAAGVHLAWSAAVPWTRTSGGPWPPRRLAIGVPSFEATVSTWSARGGFAAIEGRRAARLPAPRRRVRLLLRMPRAVHPDPGRRDARPPRRPPRWVPRRRSGGACSSGTRPTRHHPQEPYRADSPAAMTDVVSAGRYATRLLHRGRPPHRHRPEHAGRPAAAASTSSDGATTPTARGRWGAPTGSPLTPAPGSRTPGR